MPARLSRVASAASTYGISLHKPKSGSHYKFKKPHHRTYPVPAHNGMKTVISDVYIKGLCRNFALDYDEFKEKL